MGFKIKTVKKIPQRFVGMNFYAARALGIPFPYDKDVILVKKSLSSKDKRDTVGHERVEIYHMKRGLSYRKAHKIADEMGKRW